MTQHNRITRARGPDDGINRHILHRGRKVPIFLRLLLIGRGGGQDLVVAALVEVFGFGGLERDAVEPFDAAGAGDAGGDDADGGAVVGG